MEERWNEHRYRSRRRHQPRRIQRLSQNNVGGTLFFTANDETSGRELWKSDGTSTGTIRVADIQSGPSGSYIDFATNIGSTLYFSATDGLLNGQELWKSDGTSSGTVVVREIGPGSISSFPVYLTNVGGTLYFRATDGTSRSELWKSDGTSTGTVLVRDIWQGADGTYLNLLTSVGNKLYFRAKSSTNGAVLWKSNGTSIGTVRVTDIRQSVEPIFLTNVGGTLFFVAFESTTGIELWKSNGTRTGTFLVSDIQPGTGNAFFQHDLDSALTNVGGTLYFIANDGTTGYELWKSDGTSSGTVLVRDIWPGTYGSLQFVRPDLTNVDGTLFFTAYDGTSGQQLWKSDGTSTGTVRVIEIQPASDYFSPQSLTNVGGTLFFTANDGTSGRELWKSDGTSTGTLHVPHTYQITDDSYSRDFLEVAGAVFFVANYGAYGEELWRSDGTSAGTVLVRDIWTGASGSSPHSLVNVGGTLYFSVNDGIRGYELWRSNGTSTGTVLVSDIRPGERSSSPSSLINVGGILYFNANDGTTGDELWKSDGTNTGTIRVADIVPGVGGSSPAHLTNMEGTVYFRAYYGTIGYMLWKSDGTSTGTVLVVDANARVFIPYAPFFLNVAGTLFFTAGDGMHGLELWKSDGTSSGTVLVLDILPGVNSSYPRYLTNVGGTLYFTANDETSGYELWKSDGTSTGTVRLTDIRPGAYGSSPRYLANVGGTLYFSANDGISGYELWKSDGTSTGTIRVADVQSDAGGSSPRYLTNWGGMLYFCANDGNSGYELWTSNGTSTGTVRVADIRSGAGGSFPHSLTSVGDTFIFTANDGIHGQEPWILRNLDPPEINVQRSGVNIADGDVSPSAADGTDFGTATANTSATYITRQFTIQNTGAGTLNLGTITLSPASSNWAITQQPAATVAPGGSTTFKLRFQPTGGGFLQANILIPNDDPNENPYDFAVRGYGITPGARIERNNLLILDGSTSPTVEDGSDFTAAGANVSAERVTREFIVKNTGSTTLTLGSVSVTTGTPAQWAVTQQPATSLAPGASTTFKVRFQPTATGLATATVHLPTNDPVYGDYTFDIRGVGTDATFAAEIEIRRGAIVIVDGDVSPSSADGTDFGSAVANDVNARVTRQFTIDNLGVAPLVLKDPLRVFIDTTTPADWKVTKLPDGVIQPGGSTTFNVRFQPTSAGLKTATIRILNTDGNESPYDFAIQGLGTSAFAAALAERMAHDHVRHEVSDVTGLKAGRQEPALHGLALHDAVWQDDLAWLALRAADELLPPRERKK